MSANELLVKLGLDTGSFSQKIKGVNSQVKLVESEFKKLGAGVKNFEKTAKGMESSLQKLTKQYELQKTKLGLYKTEVQKTSEVLKKATEAKEKNKQKLQQLTAAYDKSVKSTSKNSEASKKLADEIKQVSTELTKNEKQALSAGNRLRKLETDANLCEAGMNKLESEIKQVTRAMKNAKFEQFSAKMKNFSEGAKKVSNTFSGISSAMGKVTVPLIAAGAGILKVSSDFEAAMSKVEAVSGATGKDLDSLRELAKKMGADTKFSATESADALYYMGLAGWKTNQMLAGLPGILSLAAAGGTDLALTSDIVTDGLTGIGMSAEQTNEFVDIMAATMSNSNTTVSLMGETMKYAASPAGSLGITMKDLSLAIGLMANSGIKGSQAGTSLRAGFLRLVGSTSTVEKAMAKYGVTLAKNKDGSVDLYGTIVNLRKALGGLNKTQKAAALNTIFGTNAVTGWMAVLNASESDVTKLKGAIDNSSGSAKKMADIMNNNLKGKVIELKSKLEGLGIQLGEILIPIASKFVDKLMELTKWFSELSPATQESIIKFAGLWIAVNAGCKSISVLSSGLGGAAKLFGGISSVIGKFSAASASATVAAEATAGGVEAVGLAAGASVLPVLGWIAAIAATGYGLYKVHETLSEEVVPEVDLFADRLEQTGTVMTQYGERAEMTAIKISEGTKKNVGAYMELDKKASQAMFSLQANATKSAEEVNKSMVDYFKNAADRIGGINEGTKTKILSEFNQISDGTGKITENMYNSMMAKMHELLNSSKDLSQQQKEAILAEYSALYQQSGQMTKEWVGQQVDTFNQMGTKIKEGVQTKQNEQLTSLREYFAESNAITAEEEGKILEQANQYWEQKKTHTDENLKQIEQLLQESYNRHGTLTQEYADKIKIIQGNMKTEAITVLSETEAESAVILQRLNDYSGRLTTEMASTAIKNAEETKQKSIKAAEDKYDGVIKNIALLKKQGIDLSEEQERAMVEAAKRERDDTVEAANQQKDKVIQKIKEMDSQCLRDVNTTSGKIMNAYDKIKAGWDEWYPKAKNFFFNVIGSLGGGPGNITAAAGGQRSFNEPLMAEYRAFAPFDYTLDLPETRFLQLSGDFYSPFSEESENFSEKLAASGYVNSSIADKSNSDNVLEKILEAIENLKAGEVNQQINVFNPQPSPRELARQIRKQSEDLVRG